MNDNPFETYAPKQDDSMLSSMIKLANEMFELETTKEDVEKELKEINLRLNTIKSSELPDMFGELGLSEFKLENGIKLKVQDFVSGSLPKDETKRKEAIAWIEANDGSDLIKTKIGMEFTKNQHNMAIDVAERLKEEGYEVDCKSDIHSQTLCSFARERLKNGDELPIELLGLYVGKTTKVVK